MNDGTVVAVAEVQANHLEGVLGQPFGQEHSDLSGRGDLLFPGLADKEFLCKTEVCGDRFLDTLYVEFLRVHAHALVVDRAGCSHAEFDLVDGAVCHNVIEGALEFADVGADVAAEKSCDFFAQVDAVDFRLLMQDGDSRFEVRRFAAGHQTPLKPGYEAFLKTL